MRARASSKFSLYPKQTGASYADWQERPISSRSDLKRLFKKFLFLFFYRKNHSRQLESLQASLETEVKAKSDLVITRRFIYSTIFYSLPGEEFSSNIFYLLSNRHYVYLGFITRVQ